MEPASLYDRVGGMAFFDELVARFYTGVASDAVLRPMYPEDLAESKRHLSRFLAQYWGGPRDYQDERGHPRLRMRHAPFVIDDVARDAWRRHMLGALGEMELSELDRDELTAYLEMASEQLRNA